MKLAATLFGERYEFRDIKDLLAKANEEKSGDQLAGVAAESAAERMAAKFVLSEVTLETLRENPAVPYEEDEVTRVIDDAVNEAVYAEIKGMTVGELREWLLADTTTGRHDPAAQHGLTPEMVAAVAKLMSNLDLMVAAQQDPGGQARQQHDRPAGHAGVALPAEPPDRLGRGDPGRDLRGAQLRLRRHRDRHQPLRRLAGQRGAAAGDDLRGHHALGGPHPELRAGPRHHPDGGAAQGAPVGLVFQSLAGSQKGNESFGIDVGMLDEAYALAKRYSVATGPELHVLRDRAGRGALRRRAPRRRPADAWRRAATASRSATTRSSSTPWSGSSARSTCTTPRRSRAPGSRTTSWASSPASRWAADVCYTNHARSTQNELENLAVLLGAAGVQLHHGHPDGRRLMLSYQSSSFHDAPEPAAAARPAARCPSSRPGWKTSGSCATAD